MNVAYLSAVKCPQCNYERTETMPSDACLIVYQCKGCDAVLHPLPGDCCIFCSYGSAPCPPVQRMRADSERDRREPISCGNVPPDK